MEPQSDKARSRTVGPPRSFGPARAARARPKTQPRPGSGSRTPARQSSPWAKRRSRRLRARRVRRLVRHVEPWSVLKVSLIFYFCLWLILLGAGVILWNLAVGSGAVANIENFVRELFAMQSFEINGDQIFRIASMGGLVLVVAGSAFTVLLAVLFNLISDITGGVRMTVVEEETARPRARRTRFVRRVPTSPLAAPSGGPAEAARPAPQAPAGPPKTPAGPPGTPLGPPRVDTQTPQTPRPPAPGPSGSGGAGRLRGASADDRPER